MNRSTLALVGMYLGAIVAANLTVAWFGPAVAIVNAFVFIAFDLTSGDRLHEAWHGRGLVYKMAALILAGSLLSYAIDGAAGPIALASFVAFAVSASLDRLVYALLGKRGYLVKVNGSNLVSSCADSIIFPTLAFGVFMPWLILAQFVAKVAGGLIWAYILKPRATPIHTA
jgi:queuosine precursor transporter